MAGAGPSKVQDMLCTDGEFENVVQVWPHNLKYIN